MSNDQMKAIREQCHACSNDMKRALAIGLVAYALHFAWEMAQGGLFVGMTRLPFWSATAWCARAAAWDVVISFVSYAAASAVSRDVIWPLKLGVSLAIYLVAGIAITIAIERWAVAAGRWSYAPEMPAIGGIGLSPLLQWVVVPIAVVALVRLVARRSERAEVS